MSKFLVALCLMAAGPAHADFMPPNNLHLQDWMEASGGVDEASFKAINAQLMAAYTPIVARFGAKLQMQADWNNSTVNASASQAGSFWNLNMYGGLARRPEVTPDGYAMVICHELGHHIAGFPTYLGDWAAAEGQSDYFATHSCAKKIWGSADNSSVDPDPAPEEACNRAYSAVKDRQLCYRVAMAGKSLAALLGALGGTKADWSTPDTHVVPKTAPQHPAAQCRLDTYLAGGLCAAKWRDGVIPGKDNPNGQDTVYAQYDALSVSCNTRPRCWYASK